MGIDCSKCPTRGACCCSFELDRKIVAKNLNKFQVTPLRVIEEKDKLRLITGDNRCVFLNRKTNACMIYEDRPDICKDYGIHPNLPCPYFKSNGRERTDADKKKHMRKIMQNVRRHEGLK